MSSVILRPSAESDLEDISDYIAEQSSDEQAKTALLNIACRLKWDARQPNVGRRQDELFKGMRSFSVYRYVVFYLPLKDGIEVVRIIHGARELDAIGFEEKDEADLL
ncbi:MAG: type II toxin-antitoxin system RelE/ParE family toxin [Chloroflexota bacterium]